MGMATVYFDNGDVIIGPQWFAERFSEHPDCQEIVDYETGEVFYTAERDPLELRLDK